MGDIVKEMLHHMPEGLMGFGVFLATVRTIPVRYRSTTVQAVVFLTQGFM